MMKSGVFFFGISSFLPEIQPRSQGLSSLPPLVVGRETLVAAGHVTTRGVVKKSAGRVG